MKFGFIGLGKMGGSVCKTLLRNGGQVTVYDINPQTVKAFEILGARSASSSREVAHDMDMVITSLPMPADLDKVLLGDDGIYAGMRQGAVHVDISTVAPATARIFANTAEKYGLRFLACPLGKGPAQAEAGEAPIFAGGKKEVFEAMKDVLKKLGNPVTYMGDVEQSTAFKLITNLVGMTNVIVMAEGVKLAKKLGIEPTVFMESYKDTGAMSYQFAVRAPWIFNDDYTPRFAVNLALKDVKLGVEMAKLAGVNCRAFANALETYTQAVDSKLGNEDCIAVYKLL
jgi:3-hydroxyisobutyrate dehydrogenase